MTTTSYFKQEIPHTTSAPLRILTHMRSSSVESEIKKVTPGHYKTKTMYKETSGNRYELRLDDNDEIVSTPIEISQNGDLLFKNSEASATLKKKSKVAEKTYKYQELRN